MVGPVFPPDPVLPPGIYSGGSTSCDPIYFDAGGFGI